MCGATGAQKSAQQQEAEISSQMASNYQTVFGQNENILKSISGALTPIVEAGPSQYGFSAEEDAAMRTQATSQNAAAAKNASDVTRSGEAAQGGGNILLPTGAQSTINAGLAENAANQQANSQLGITQAGYNTGRANFFGAEGALAGAPGELENPATGAGSAATSASAQALNGATQIQQANDAWIGDLTGLIGGITGGILSKKGGGGSSAAPVPNGDGSGVDEEGGWV